MKRVISALLFASIGLGAACDRQQPKVDQVPVGSDVQLTRSDGALVEGKLLDRDAKKVQLDVGPATKSVPREDIADLRVKTDADRTVPKAAQFREIALPPDTKFVVRLDTPVSSATIAVETAVRGELSEPVIHKGMTVIQAGATVSGVVSSVQSSGRVKGRASLSLAFTELTIGTAHYPIDARFSRTAEATKSSDAKKVGIPAAGGAIIGAIIGGGKGAAIGAAAGGGAGTAAVLATAGKEIVLERGTILSIEAGQIITVRVPLS